MKKPPTRYSADGRWWWDGEQWKAVDTTPPAAEDDGTYPSLRSAGSARQRLVVTTVLAVLVILIVLALWLVGTHLALPSSRATPTPIPTSTPTPRPTPSAAAVQAAVARYRRAVTAGTNAVTGRAQTVDRDCAVPADLATCRSALVALGKADVRFRSSLTPAPDCLAGADTRLRAAIGAMDRAESTAVAGIDQGQPATIEGGLAAVGTGRQQLVASSGQVDAASC
ncbi:MAG TPA: hypothetical protein VIA06_04165 [Candidatus Dormibacteraeota bacterium]|jgi:hypothetical protein|nr:hypothetical protein [Candidatus Dormibacteraeota bacterium]